MLMLIWVLALMLIMLKAGCLCGRADGSCLPMCAISPLGMAKPLTLACSSPSSVVAQPLTGHHLLMHHESPGAFPRRSPPPRRPATSLSERYSLRIPKNPEDCERRRRSWDEAAGVAVPGKSVTLSRQASQTAARRAGGGGGGRGGGEGGRGRGGVKSQGGGRELLVPRKSLSAQDAKNRTESKSQHVSLPNIANKPQKMPRNTKNIVSNVTANAKKQPQVKGAKIMNGQGFNWRQNSLKAKHFPTVGFNSEEASRLQPRSSSLREPKPSLLARNQSFQSNPRRAHSDLDLHRSNPSLSKLTSSEAGSTIPTGWRSQTNIERAMLPFQSILERAMYRIGVNWSLDFKATNSRQINAT